MSENPDSPSGEYIGAGRSATVFRLTDEAGNQIARKVFTSETLSTIILFILTGAGNPYTWCSHAMATAVSRRRVLARLVSYWFDDKLRLPQTHGWEWNAEHRAFELRSELILGTHAPLLDPLSAEPMDYFDDLYEEVMKPLQRHLLESGLDGLLWQAGYGNPVAANNFMLEKSDSSLPNWVWIDLESGVPALFAINPVRTFGYYLPMSLKHGRWLFDDVDCTALRSYLSAHRRNMEEKLGAEALAELDSDVDELEQNQDQWRAIGRISRSIQYALSRDKITRDQADYYTAHPLRWQLLLLTRALQKALQKLTELPSRVASWFKKIEFSRVVRRSLNYIRSSRFRWGVARWFVARRIKSWTRRGYLQTDSAFKLRRMLHHDDSSAYLTDFSVHIAIKPTADVLAWGLFPFLWVTGSLPQALLPVFIILIGPLLRVSYTATRIVQEILRRQKPQWVALFVGALPGFGNLAYPTQLLYRSAENSGELARFIIYDICAAIGRKIPIWGGADSQTEHVFNRVCDRVVRWLNHVLERKAVLNAAQKSHHDQ
jgi:hypothetical protein